MRQWHWYLGSLPRELAMRKMSSRDFTVCLRAVAWQHKFAVNASTDAGILIDLCKLILKDRRKIKSLILQHCKLLERPHTILLVFGWENKLCPHPRSNKESMHDTTKGPAVQRSGKLHRHKFGAKPSVLARVSNGVAQCRWYLNLEQEALRDNKDLTGLH